MQEDDTAGQADSSAMHAVPDWSDNWKLDEDTVDVDAWRW